MQDKDPDIQKLFFDFPNLLPVMGGIKLSRINCLSIHEVKIYSQPCFLKPCNFFLLKFNLIFRKKGSVLYLFDVLALTVV